MRELNLEERKEISLKILNYIKKVCDDNNLSYFLAYGTLIGCIRHKGFIPWDDDIDIWVPVKDYDQLMTLLKESDKFELLDYKEGKEWRGYFSKLSDPNTSVVSLDSPNKKRGVAVDIFPLFTYPDDKKLYKKAKKYSYMANILGNYYHKQYKSIVKKMYCFILNLIGLNYKHYINKLFNLEHKVKGDYYVAYNSIYKERDIHKKELFTKIPITKINNFFILFFIFISFFQFFFY